MTKSEISLPAKMNDAIVYLLASVFFALFLFYIDEGYYSFKWMASIGTWIIFVVYVAGLFLGPLLISKLVSMRFSGRRKRALSLMLGLPIGLAFLFLLFSHSIGK